MAKLSSNGKSVTVEKGDTLSEIADAYYSKFGYSDYKTYQNYLANLNNISNPNYITIGQVIRLTGSTATATQTPTNVQQAYITVTNFGLQANTDRTMYASWTWSRKNTKNYQVKWFYDTGNGVWFNGNGDKGEETTSKQSVYNAPTNAVKIKFMVRPIATTHKVNGKDTAHWEASWSTPKEYSFSSNPPTVPPVPTVELKDYTLTMRLDNLDVNAPQIEFEVYRDDKYYFDGAKVDIKSSAASYQCTVKVGSQYKVHCRAVRGTLRSGWSNYSSNFSTIPATPSGITRCQASSETSVYISWNAAKGATSYDIQYTFDKTYFEGSDQVTTINNIEGTSYTKTGLESGKEYFFRVRAVNSAGYTAWTDIASVKIGKAPAAPTTWSSTTTAVSGESVVLHWIHNSQDESPQNYAEIELDIGGTKQFIEINDTAIEDKEDKTYEYAIDTSGYLEGAKILWRVRTKGTTDEYSAWSAQRSIDIYAPPTLELGVTDVNDEPMETLKSFPIRISAVAGPDTQTPVGYYVSVVANESYETLDGSGASVTINSGDEVYYKFFDISESLNIELSANNINLVNNVSYTIKCSVTMNSGLTAQKSRDILVAWSEELVYPNAQIGVDEESYSATIGPYCECYATTYYVVEYSDEANEYIVTENTIDAIVGTLVEDEYSNTGHQVYRGILGNGTEVHFCMIVDDEPTLSDDITLAVYRREFDGRLVEIMSDIPNDGSTFVTDPHPSLDYARYRVVATSKSTGAVSYSDISGHPVGCKAVVIQWNENWSDFDATVEDVQEQPSWSGSLLRLPYNIDVSEKTKPDVELVEYIGRLSPVSYYGTHIGESATWNVVIEKDDVETLYALRRLNKWMGDVYVREPSGCGYWANVNVSFGQKHRNLTIPVTIDIVRVEGGI